MRIVFNSKMPEAACSLFYYDALQSMENVTFYDYEHFSEYDIALFMTYKCDLEDLERVKREYPGLKTAIVDPRGSWVDEYLKYADFLVVDSIEMRDYWAYSDLPIFEYAEYPNIPLHKRDHTVEKEKVIIGYHGNLIHLESMAVNITPAIERLAQDHSIEFWAMYNADDQNKWVAGVPEVEVKHIPWSMENYSRYLSRVDVGIVPCFLPESRCFDFWSFPLVRKFNRFNKTKEDYLLRFKMPTNPGRIIVWGLLNIPVISDFFPSAMQCIEDKKSGLLACHSGGWFKAFKTYIEDAQLRQCCADNLTRLVKQKYDFKKQNETFSFFLRSIS